MPDPQNPILPNIFYISATSSILDPERLVLKDGEVFGVFNRFGDILPIGRRDQGLYYEDTRFLSLHEIRINSLRPIYLGASVDEDGMLLNVDLTNPDIYEGNTLSIPKDSLHILRSKVIFNEQYLERIRIRNYSRKPVTISLLVLVDADFKDIFEIRGFHREREGILMPVNYGEDRMEFSYKGLDGVIRKTLIKSSGSPCTIRNKCFVYEMSIEPNESKEVYTSVICKNKGDSTIQPYKFRETLNLVRTRNQKLREEIPSIETSHEQFNESIARSLSDLNMMTTKTEEGYYPYGGIPWFCTPFGRDGIITALETLWLRPEIARGVLGFLASKQAREKDPKKYCEPGKIFHEVRNGELAATGEIPFGLYYGSIDSTPLFVMLAGAYWKRTGDLAFIKSIWENIKLALEWMDKYGDMDGDGYIEYLPDEDGLINQGWKDSDDSVFHEDGSRPEGPIALCEIQGYQYAAKLVASEMAATLGEKELSSKLREDAMRLKERFNRDFWNDKLNSYVLALDGKKRQCRVLTSNAGHALFTGIADSEKALKVADTLLSDKMFSGWGIRTLSTDEVMYNPMSYHNGSVWPHDNALIASGLAAYNLKDHFLKVFTGIFEASVYMDFQRMPELFCGFERRKDAPPVLYPVACSPQSWASGSLIYMLQASLGIEFDITDNTLTFKRPVLPDFLEWVLIRNLSLKKDMTVDLMLRRYEGDVTVEVLSKPEELTIRIIK